MWSTGQFASPWPSGLVTDRGRPFTCASVIYMDMLIRHSVRSPFLRKKRLRGGSCSCLEGSQPATRNKFLLRPHFSLPCNLCWGHCRCALPCEFSCSSHKLLLGPTAMSSRFRAATSLGGDAQSPVGAVSLGFALP